MKTTRLMFLMLAACGLLAVAGCSDDDPAAPGTTTPTTTLATAEKDAATTVAADLGADQGGLVDQIADAVSFAGRVGLADKAGGDCEGMRQAEYDTTTGTWTITIDRERGDPAGYPYASFTRVFTVRFLDADGQPQMHYMEQGTAAATIEYAILSGEGVRRTRYMEHNLLSLEAAFVISNADQDLVTVNGTWARAAGTLLENPRLVRTHDSTLQLELIDVVAPRSADHDLAQAVSGTIVGVYDALITWTRGEDYSEREIHSEFTIDLGDGEGMMTMDRTQNQYRLRLKTGELVEE
ncbi:MAG: hypothetical protein R6X35_06710 [Candidatus Krumholzibacteriia bacterium]